MVYEFLTLHLTNKHVKIARMMACLDYRLELDKIAQSIGYSRKYVLELIKDLRDNWMELWAQHIRDIRPLRLKTLLIRSREILDTSGLNLKIDLDSTWLPASRFLYSYRVTVDNNAVYTYIVPEQLEEELVEEIANGIRGDELSIGYVVPIKMNCSRLLTVSDRIDEKDLDVLVEEAYRDVSAMPQALNYGVIELIVYAVLDVNPLATRKEMLDLSQIVKELGYSDIERIWLKGRKVYSIYEELSRRGLLGRVLLLRALPQYGSLLPLYVEVEEECFPRLYTLVSLLGIGASVFHGKNLAATVMVIPDSFTELVRTLLRGCIRYSGVISGGFGVGLPVEMFSPKEGWHLEPQPLVEMLWSMGLIHVERKDAIARKQ